MKKIILFLVILSGILGNAQENIKQSKHDNDLKLSAFLIIVLEKELE